MCVFGSFILHNNKHTLACSTVGVAGMQAGSNERLQAVVLFCAWTESIIVFTNGPNSIVVFKP
jgi:hypothetical protein